jgi:uncharacterized protein involved in response to NO
MTIPTHHLLGLERQAPAPGAFSLFERGFRPFFLLAAAFGACAVPLWLLALYGGLQPGGSFGSMQWHAHEMLFGFTTAVIAGFLLTAITNWTGRRTATGAALGALGLLWLLGRAAMLFLSRAPRVAAAADGAFLPVLTVVCAIPILAARDRRNYPFIGILVVLSALNALAHRAALQADLTQVRDIHALALDLIVLVMVLVTGRIVPSFTRNATGIASTGTNRTLEGASALAVLAMLVADTLRAALAPAPMLVASTAALSLLAAALLAVRMRRWGSWQARRDPLLWILHLGSAWLPVGLLLRAGSLVFAVVPAGSALHALTAGAIGCLTLGMMARVSLGHTGRMLRASRATVVAFVCVAVAGVVRVLAPLVPSVLYLPVLDLAGAAWSSAFLIFLFGHVRILVTARADAR